MRLAAIVAAMVVSMSSLGGCQSPKPADSHRCVVTPNDTVECSEVD